MCRHFTRISIDSNCYGIATVYTVGLIEPTRERPVSSIVSQDPNFWGACFSQQKSADRSLGPTYRPYRKTSSSVGATTPPSDHRRSRLSLRRPFLTPRRSEDAYRNREYESIYIHASQCQRGRAIQRMSSRRGSLRRMPPMVAMGGDREDPRSKFLPRRAGEEVRFASRGRILDSSDDFFGFRSQALLSDCGLWRVRYAKPPLNRDRRN